MPSVNRVMDSRPRLLVGLGLALLVAGATVLVGERPTRQPAGELVDIVEATVLELQEAMASGRVGSRDLVEGYLARMEAYDQRGPRLNAMISLNPNALERAAALDAERAANGPRGPLHGIPVVLKDNYDTAGMATTAASIALAGSLPPDDAFQVRRLRDAGAVILGKTNMHELASGITTVSSLGGQTRNPYDPARNPGGSSGGTGAAVAASFAVVGMGSDTCGSIRYPSAHNGLVGLRGSAGLSSRDGVIPLSHTQDVAGPLARTVTDLAIVLDATVGPDPSDPITLTHAGRLSGGFVDSLDSEALRGARVGVLRALFGDSPDDAPVADIIDAALAAMADAGAEVVDIEIPGFDELLRDSGVIGHEFKFDLIDYFAAMPDAPVSSLTEILERGLFHASLEGSFRRRVATETRDSAEYREALAKREAIATAVESVMDEHRLVAIAYPTLRRQAARIGEPQRGGNCSLSANSGLPALTVPAGLTADGMPVGLELLGRPFSDPELVGLGFAFERATDLRRPPMTTPPLIDGRAPTPRRVAVPLVGPEGDEAMTVTLAIDLVRFTVGHQLPMGEAAADGPVFAAIHRAGPTGVIGPIVHRLMDERRVATSGTWRPSGREMSDLLAGRLYLAVYPTADSAGMLRGAIAPPLER